MFLPRIQYLSFEKRIYTHNNLSWVIRIKRCSHHMGQWSLSRVVMLATLKKIGHNAIQSFEAQELQYSTAHPGHKAQFTQQRFKGETRRLLRSRFPFTHRRTFRRDSAVTQRTSARSTDSVWDTDAVTVPVQWAREDPQGHQTTIFNHKIIYYFIYIYNHSVMNNIY